MIGDAIITSPRNACHLITLSVSLLYVTNSNCRFN